MPPAASTAALSAEDLRFLAARGISGTEAAAQLARLAAPPAPARLLRPATLGDGIERIEPERAAALAARATAAQRAGRLTKLVPASGAATRMFRALEIVLERGGCPTLADLERAAAAGDAAAGEAARFVAALGALALARPLAAALGLTVAELARRAASDPVAPLFRSVLGADGLDAARLPKGLLPFHAGGEGWVTAFEEQLAEGVGYLADASGRARFHFTVAPEARAAFERALAAARPRLEAGGCRLEVSFSIQDPATDALALDAEGRPARRADGGLLLRPAGHGALLANLERLGGDLVLIKNIDNVLPAPRHAEIAFWKRVLVGRLLELEVAGRRLERPLRVCGVVPNLGEPGGGPFWVAGADGRATLQIVESSQVDAADPGQRGAFDAATHFNPVDLALSLRDGLGRPYPLARFVDPEAAFVARKSEAGRELVVFERPGLWNGAMAGWETHFVEVPAATFAPVKTVLDLARPEHRVG